MSLRSIIRNQSYVYWYFLQKILSNKRVKISEIATKENNSLEKISSAPMQIYYEKKNLQRVPEKIPQQIAKIKFWGNRSRKSVLKRLHRESIKLNQSKFYELEDVLLTNDSFYSKNYRHSLTINRRKDLLLPTTYKECDYAVLAHNNYSSFYWGHWLVSELPMQSELKNHGKFIGSSYRIPFRDESAWRSQAGLPPIEQSKVWRVNRLLIGNSTTLDPITIKNWFVIREKIQNNGEKWKKLYIKRGQTGQVRSLINEDELINKLEKIGFQVIDITKTGGDELINFLSNSDFIIGVEGSHMDPAMYTIKTGGKLIILQPPGRVGLNAVTNSSICAILSGVYICNFENDYYGFSVDIDNFLSFIDRFNRWAENNFKQFIEKRIAFKTLLETEEFYTKDLKLLSE